MSHSAGNSDSSGNRRVNLTPGAGGIQDHSRTEETSLPQQQIERSKSSIAKVPCDLCGNSTRIYTVGSLLMSGCDLCKRYVSIGRGILDQPVAPSGRGMRKETRVEPDWDLVLEDDIGQESIVAPGYELED